MVFSGILSRHCAIALRLSTACTHSACALHRWIGYSSPALDHILCCIILGAASQPPCETGALTPFQEYILFLLCLPFCPPSGSMPWQMSVELLLSLLLLLLLQVFFLSSGCLRRSVFYLQFSLRSCIYVVSSSPASLYRLFLAFTLNSRCLLWPALLSTFFLHCFCACFSCFFRSPPALRR